MASDQDDHTKLLTLRTTLVSRATGQGGDEALYQELREELLAHPRLRGRLPTFLQSCQSLGDFWSFIKIEIEGYEPRRQFLRQQFQPVFDLLEGRGRAP